jgi:hypothetical protein
MIQKFWVALEKLLFLLRKNPKTLKIDSKSKKLRRGVLLVVGKPLSALKAETSDVHGGAGDLFAIPWRI